MLRHLKTQRGGIGTLTRSLVSELIRIDGSTQYVLLYADPELLGSFGEHPNVQEVVVKAQSRLTWDQVAVPLAARRLKLDLLFNPKLSVPIFASCKTVFIMAGADWFIFPQNYKLFDRLYHQLSASMYFQKADAVISISESATHDLLKLTRIPPAKVRTVHLGVDGRFKRVTDATTLRRVRTKYQIPEHFLLWVGQIYPMKNVGGLLRAFALVRPRIRHKLVLVGKKELKYDQDLALIDALGLRNDVLLTGWVPDEDLPALYSMADAFVFPSLYEGFGIPILEAWACGCPVVTSGRGATKEVAGDAAVFVNPERPESIAHGIEQVVSHPDVRAELVLKGKRRVETFTWAACARATLNVFSSVAGNA